MKVFWLIFSLLVGFAVHAHAEDLPLLALTSKHGINFAFLQSDLQDTVAISIAFRGGMAVILALVLFTTVNDLGSVGLWDRLQRLIG